MEVIQSFVMTSCAISILFCVISSITDISKFEKEFKFVIVGIFSLVLVKSILQLDFSFFKDVSLSDNPYTTKGLSIDDYTSQIMKISLEDTIKNYLSDYGVVCENISVDINITEESCISINKVYVSTDNFLYAKQLLLERFGEDIKVLNIGGD
ncbi:MAG: hypothetical protein ACI4WH_03745 [Oscillospiraceae bacterium]